MGISDAYTKNKLNAAILQAKSQQMRRHLQELQWKLSCQCFSTWVAVLGNHRHVSSGSSTGKAASKFNL